MRARGLQRVIPKTNRSGRDLQRRESLLSDACKGDRCGRGGGIGGDLHGGGQTPRSRWSKRYVVGHALRRKYGAWNGRPGEGKLLAIERQRLDGQGRRAGVTDLKSFCCGLPDHNRIEIQAGGGERKGRLRRGCALGSHAGAARN